MLDLSQSFDFENKTIPSRQSWGRYLYLIQQNKQYYWLKCQQLNHTDKYMSFDYECQIYQLIQQLNHTLILDYQIQHLHDTVIKQLQLPHQHHTALILPHYPLYFEQSLPNNMLQLKQMIQQILTYLAEFHQLGLIHGDIKREHWLLSQHQIYLIDFEQVYTQWCTSPVKNITSTPRYMAPELFLGKNKSIASDIYALGIVLYEWIMQQRLSAHSYQQWYALHQQGILVQLTGEYQLFNPLLKLMLANQRPTSVYDVLEQIDMMNI